MDREINPFQASQTEMATDSEEVILQNLGDTSGLRRQELAIYRIGWISLGVAVMSIYLFGVPWLSRFLFPRYRSAWDDIQSNPIRFFTCLAICIGLFVAGIGLLRFNRYARRFAIAFYMLAVPVIPILSIYALLKLGNRQAQFICSETYRHARQQMPAPDDTLAQQHVLLTVVITLFLTPFLVLIGAIAFEFIISIIEYDLLSPPVTAPYESETY